MRKFVLNRRGQRDVSACGGFTVIECLVAGMVLAIFGSLIAMTVGQSVSASEAMLDRQQAALWLDEVMTRIDMIGPGRLSAEGPVQGELDDRFSWSVEIEEEGLSAYLYRVTPTIRWKTSRGEKSVAGYTMLYDPPGSRGGFLQWDELGISHE